MSYNGRYYTAPTNRVFNEYVCDLSKVVNDCYIHHLFTLHGQLTTLNPDFLLNKVNESDGELHNDLCAQISPQARQTQTANRVDESIYQKRSNASDIDSEF